MTTIKNTENVPRGLKNRYIQMISRCYNPTNQAFKHYGGRGITVCQLWIDDKNEFFKWALENGYSDCLEIDRERNNEGYHPNNCRWVTKSVNMKNRRNQATVEFRGVTYNLIDLCDKYKLSYAGAYRSLIQKKGNADDYVFRKGYRNLRKIINEHLNFHLYNS